MDSDVREKKQLLIFSSHDAVCHCFSTRDYKAISLHMSAVLLPFCVQVFDNVLVQPRDAREASDVFYRQRLGDVLLTYENEVVLTNQVRHRA
jgi:hypothetical protein